MSERSQNSDDHAGQVSLKSQTAQTSEPSQISQISGTPAPSGTQQIPGRLAGQLLAGDVVGTAELAALERFLDAQRWFPGKGRALAHARYAGSSELVHSAGEQAWLGWLEIAFADGTRGDYQLPLALVGGQLELIDATGSPGFRAQLGSALAAGRTLGTWRFERIADPGSHGSDDALTSALSRGPTRVSAAEQSNTSIIFADAAILKLFRTLAPGINPDVEISRFLTTRTRSASVPALLGVIHVITEAGSCIAGMLQRYVAGAQDGWSLVLAQLGAWMEADAPRDCQPDMSHIALLGRVTGELHQALMSDPHDPAFAPVPATRAHIGHWIASALASVDAGLERLAERAAVLDPASADLAARLAGGHAGLEAHIRTGLADLDAPGKAGLIARHHGDFHLGQTLYTPAGEWMIIDFEGEPARPLAERRAPSHPLRDVAGMLRSFAYAAATVLSHHGGPANQDAAARIAGWEQLARTSFLSAYEAARAEQAHPGLLALFELEKLFYELRYELENRPEWVWIPLGAALTSAARG